MVKSTLIQVLKKMDPALRASIHIREQLEGLNAHDRVLNIDLFFKQKILSHFEGITTPNESHFHLGKMVDKFCVLLEENYVFAEVGKACSAYLRAQMNNGAYDAITDPEMLAQVMTADLRLVSEDKHIRIIFKQPLLVESVSPEPYLIPPLKGIYTYQTPTEPTLPYEIKSGVLEENPKVGYLDLRVFGDCRGEDKEVMARREAFIAAIQNLKGTESVMIDLRNNGGGDPYAVQLLCSLFIDEGLPLNRLEWRVGDKFQSEEFNTLPLNDLPMEKRLLTQRVFLLIGSSTFSAAEEFSNNMKVLGRATLVGEPSGGGANPGGTYDVDNFMIFVPEGHAVNPIQKGNWEGVGIIPDLMVPAEQAFEEALKLYGKNS